MNNRKKLAAIALCISLFTLTSCQQAPGKSSDMPAAPTNYQDGIYKVNFTPTIEDYNNYCVIEIKQNRIKILELDGLKTDNVVKKTEDPAAKEAMIASCADNGIAPIDVAGLYSRIKQEFNKDGKISDEAAAISPITTTLVKRAVNEVVNEAKAKYQTEKSSSKSVAAVVAPGLTSVLDIPIYYDGEYKASMPYYYNGYADFITVKIENGKPTITQFDGVNEKGELKTKDEKLKADIIAANKKNNLPETYPAKFTDEIKAMYTQNSNNTLKIDNISGATQSSKCFKKMLKDILYDATFEDGNKKITSSPYMDGTYSAQMSSLANGYREYLKIAVKNGKVNIVEYNAVDAKGNLKTNDAKLTEQMKNKGLNSPANIFASIIAEFKAKNDIAKMDNIAGATASSNNFKIMLGELLERNAKTGKTDLLEIKAENTPVK